MMDETPAPQNRRSSQTATDETPERRPRGRGRPARAAGDNGDREQPATKAGPKAGQAEAKAGQVTPSMAQYLEIKAANPDSLLWYRMGDFYELFFEDAVVAADALSITLTKRGKHLGEDIPMCGVPVVRADEYLQRLIRQGYRVAVCEQLEDPAEARKRGSKAVVRRDVVRLVTPGTLTEDSLLDARVRNYLTAVLIPASLRAATAADGSRAGATSDRAAGTCALASIDMSTGEFELSDVAFADLQSELVRLNPGEILLAQTAFEDPAICGLVSVTGAAITPVPAAHFDSLSGESELKARLGVSELGGFGEFSRQEMAAAGAVLKYVEITQLGQRPRLLAPRRTSSADILMIDASSRLSLELMRTTSGERRGGLLHAIDRTVTGAGARELAARLSAPLRDPARIAARLDAVSYLLDGMRLREACREALKGAPDISRALSRLSLQRGTPRDLAALRDALAAALRLGELLDAEGSGRAGNGAVQGVGAGALGLPQHLEELSVTLRTAPRELADRLRLALADDPPATRKDGGFVREGYSAELDEARRLRQDSRQVIARLERQYAEQTGVKSLKIKHNNILGYFIEVTQNNAGPLQSPPHDAVFRHRQTMANAMRFTTEELSEIEGRIASAGERSLKLENEIFEALAGAIGKHDPQISAVAAALARLDVYAGLAELAEREAYSRPTVEDSMVFDIRGGRHPVVEQALRRDNQGPFIENDCLLSAGGDRECEADLEVVGDDLRAGAERGGPEYPDPNGVDPMMAGFGEAAEARIWLVTGPNMAGKSTFLRQNALIAIMAQIGSFVPARYARIGALDRVFSRVGASDDLARGRSTFMVEMVETAAILNAAGPRSLVILDEIGRGTATFDGLSIAWACVEYLHERCGSRALFATHYHEMTALAQRLDGVANVTIEVREWKDAIVFLHKVKPGAADRSYGIQVAKLAGLPADVIARAGEVLKKLEENDHNRGQASGGTSDPFSDLPLFAAARPRNPAADPPRRDPALDALCDLNPDELSPKEALEALYRLKTLAKQVE